MEIKKGFQFIDKYGQLCEVVKIVKNFAWIKSPMFLTPVPLEKLQAALILETEI